MLRVLDSPHPIFYSLAKKRLRRKLRSRLSLLYLLILIVQSCERDLKAVGS